MNMFSNSELRQATKGLTGNREKDIEFLKTQIASNRFDEYITAALMRILSGLSFPGKTAAAA